MKGIINHKKSISFIKYGKGCDSYMLLFIIHSIVWILALYGLFEIIKTIIYLVTYTNLTSDGIYCIIATKNQEGKIEGFLRSLLFRILYGKEDILKDLIITDLDSDDNTLRILTKLQSEYPSLQILPWRECKDIIDNIKSS